MWAIPTVEQSLGAAFLVIVTVCIACLLKGLLIEILRWLRKVP